MILFELIKNFINYFDSSECLSLEIKILRREKANVERQNSELTEALQAKTVEIESLIKHLERYNLLSWQSVSYVGILMIFIILRKSSILYIPLQLAVSTYADIKKKSNLNYVLYIYAFKYKYFLWMHELKIYNIFSVLFEMFHSNYLFWKCQKNVFDDKKEVKYMYE